RRGPPGGRPDPEPASEHAAQPHAEAGDSPPALYPPGSVIPARSRAAPGSVSVAEWSEGAEVSPAIPSEISELPSGSTTTPRDIVAPLDCPPTQERAGIACHRTRLGSPIAAIGVLAPFLPFGPVTRWRCYASIGSRVCRERRSSGSRASSWAPGWTSCSVPASRPSPAPAAR